MMNSGERIVGQSGTQPPVGAGRPQRVYEVARELGMENKDFLARARGLGIDAKNHMSLLSPDDVSRVRRALDKDKQQSVVEERVASTVIRRRASKAVTTRPVEKNAASASPQ